MTRRSLFAAIAGLFGVKAAPTRHSFFVHGAPNGQLVVRTATAARLMASKQTISKPVTFFWGAPIYSDPRLPPNSAYIFNLKAPKCPPGIKSRGEAVSRSLH